MVIKTPHWVPRSDLLVRVAYTSREQLIERRREVIHAAMDAMAREDWATVSTHGRELLELDRQIVAQVVADSAPLAEQSAS